MSDQNSPNDPFKSFTSESIPTSLDYQEDINKSLGITNEPVQSKADILAARKQEKLQKLGGTDQFSSMSDSYTELDNGILESNRNKIWNDLSGAEYKSLFDYARNSEALGQDEQGYFNIATGDRFEGPVRRFYGYGTKDSDQAFKAGTARGDRPSSDSRYQDYDSGISGVDITKKEYDILFPEYIANTLEGVGQGRKEALSSRLVPNTLDYDQYEKYGSGASEYYSSKEGFFGDPTSKSYGTRLSNENAKNLLRDLATQNTTVSKYYKGNYSDDWYTDAYYKSLSEEATKSAYKNQTALDEVGQTISALPAGVAKGVLDLLDAGQEIATYFPQTVANLVTGKDYDIDLFDDGLKQSLIESVDNAVGYTRKFDELALQDAMSKLEESGVDITSLDSIKSVFSDPEKRAAVGDAALTLLTDPSLTASMVTELVGSGGALGSLGKAGTKVLSKISPKAAEKVTNALKSNATKIREQTAAAIAAKDTAKIAQLEKSYTFTKKVGDLVKGNVYSNADMMVRMNNDITTFTENNNGEGPDAEKLFTIALTNRIVSSAEVMSLRSLVGMGAVEKIPKKVVEQATKDGVTKAVGYAAGRVLRGGVQEGIQETFDSVVEQVNQKVGSADYEGKSVGDVLSEASAEILTGTLAGTGSGVQISGSGEALRGVVPTIGAGADLVGRATTSFTPNTEVNQQETDVESSDAKAALEKVISDNIKARSETTDPAVAYYAAQGSANPELIAEAKKEAKAAEDSIINGTNTVFNSDEEFSVKLPKMKPFIEIAVAENPNLTVEEIQRAIIKGLKSENNVEQEAEIATAVAEAHSSGMQFASIKPITETAKEVSEGARGFVTYLANAKAALAQGDTAKYEENLNELDRFYSFQVTKAERLNSGVEQVSNTIEKQVDTLVKQGKAKNRNEALSIVSKNSGDKRIEVTHVEGGKSSSEIKYSDVINKLRNPSYDKGIYKLVGTIANEAQAIKSARDSIIGVESTAVPTVGTAPVTPVNSTPDNIPVVDAPTIEPSGPVDSTSVNTAMSEEDFLAAEAEEINIAPTNVDSASITSMDEQEIARLEALESIEEEYFLEEEELSLEDLENDRPPLESLEDLENDIVSLEDLESLDSAGVPATTTNTTEVLEKDTTVALFNDTKNKIKAIKKRIVERKSELRASGVNKLSDVIQDPEMQSLFTQKESLDASVDNDFPSKAKDKFEKRLKGFTTTKAPVIKFLSYAGGKKTVELVTDKLVKAFKPTGFTLSDRTKDTANKSTKQFAATLLENMKIKDGSFNFSNSGSVNNNPITLFLFNDKGELDYAAVEALQAASYEFLTQEATNLLGVNRSTQDIADLFDVNIEEVTPEMYEAFVNGGVTYKLAAPAIGEKFIKNLGLTFDSIQSKEVLATSFGMAALKSLEGDFISINSYNEDGITKGTVDYIKGLPSMYYSFSGRKKPNLKDARKQLEYFEEKLGVEISKERNYRREGTSGRRKVYIHKSDYQEAPKDHQETVNRLENTPFSFNDGHNVLVELFSNSEGNLDTAGLIRHILGNPNEATNQDAKDRYKAQEEALTRDIQFYLEAKKDVQEGNMFFNWFIGKNQRIHLDSNRLNPQNDKNLARWLVTTNNSKSDIKKSDIENLLNGKKASKEAVMFVYGLIQAFDGAEGMPDVDKNNQKDVIAAAKVLLEDTTDSELVAMAKSAKLVGHSALGLANIRKYMDADTSFNSDMVLEVDGLTNGFAFRAMQFPLGPKAYEWLEKVGVIREGSKFFDLESMNRAKEVGQDDVYNSVGFVFQDNMVEAKELLDDVSTGWISLFEEVKSLPDFSDKNDDNVKKFLRNLMKSPVMVFNYAAGKEKIASSLVNDQVMGTGYLDGRGLIDTLTRKDDKGSYVITEARLIEVFGKERGTSYHNTRKDLAEKSINDKKRNDIVELRQDLVKAVSGLYQKPLSDALDSLFSEQTEVNNVITEAGQFMFAYFKKEYNLWKIQNPSASEEEKTEYLRSIAQIVPGVAGASTDDQLNKVTFLKNVLEPTGDYVVTNVGGTRTSTNTISRGYGDPGVGPAVLLVLSSDSATLSKTINQMYAGEKGAGLLPIHDAMILGITDFDAISKYNANFYTVNRNYSIVNEFENAINNLKRVAPDVTSLKIYNKTLSKLVTFGDMQERLAGKNIEVQQAREELFSSKLKVGQMVGPEGSMLVVDPEEMKAVAKRTVAEATETLLTRFKEKKIKKALGKEYNTALARIEKMLEGCK